MRINSEKMVQNELILAKNENLKEQQKKIIQDLEKTKEQLSTETDRLENLVTKNNQLMDEAEQKANDFYQIKLSEFNNKMQIDMRDMQEKYEAKKEEYLKELEHIKFEVQDIERKQEAYIQAQQRQAAIDADRDYYRLAIDEVELEDIKQLRELQKHFSKKEVIDKVIWENYYRQAYDILSSHLFNTRTKISGIYKITDLSTGQAYIGQSVDCKERLRTHIKTGLSYSLSTNKLYRAMKKSGIDNFIFELLEEVSKDKLNEREKYWIEFYRTKEQLNGTKGGS